MASGRSEHETPPHDAMQLEFMLRREGGKGNGNPVPGRILDCRTQSSLSKPFEVSTALIEYRLKVSGGMRTYKATPGQSCRRIDRSD